MIHAMARRLVPALALGLVLAMFPLSQARADEIYTIHARGVIDVAPDGTVAALELHTDLDEAAPAYESLMREWRFNPIMTTGGQRVERTVRVNVEVDLYATHKGDGSFGVSTGQPRFEPVADPGHTQRTSRLAHLPSLRYPEEALAGGYEGTVVLLLEVAADGSVTRVGTYSAALLNVRPRGPVAAALRPFLREAHRAVRQARFVPSDHALREVLLPISFRFHGRDENSWSRIVFVPRAQEPWVREKLARSSREVEKLDAGGQPVDAGVALATVIDDPWL